MSKKKAVKKSAKKTKLGQVLIKAIKEVTPKKTREQIQAEKLERKKQREAEIAKQRSEEMAAIKAAYCAHVDEVGFHPSKAQMLQRGHSTSSIVRLFGNITYLRQVVKSEFPEVFENVFDESDFTTERFKEVLKEIPKYKKFLITSAVNGCSVHKEALHSVEAWCDANDALLLLLPSNDPAHNLDNRDGWNFDPVLKNKSIVFDEVQLNSNIFISSILVGAKQINPTTGLGRITQNKGSAIFASPKQSLEFDAVSNVKYPHARLTTGAITLPDYSTNRFMSERTAYIAHHDHVMGGIVVEIADDVEFHFRQVQFDKDGGFCDLGIYYNSGKTKKIKSKIVFGDYHASEVDQSAKKAAAEIVNQIGCDEIIMHDFHNGSSTGHHNENKMILKAKMAAQGQLSLLGELECDANELNFWAANKNIQKITMVRSNHDEVIDRWLEEARFTKEPENTMIGCFLAYHAIRGANPLQKGLEEFTKLSDATKKKVSWLKRDQDYKYAGFELSAHGDKGPNGSKGSKQALEKAYPAAVIGHSHTPGILRKIIQVGTKSILRPGYAQGPSSWMQTDCIIYENGHYQLINIIGGKWRLK